MDYLVTWRNPQAPWQPRRNWFPVISRAAAPQGAGRALAGPDLPRPDPRRRPQGRAHLRPRRASGDLAVTAPPRVQRSASERGADLRSRQRGGDPRGLPEGLRGLDPGPYEPDEAAVRVLPQGRQAGPALVPDARRGTGLSLDRIGVGLKPRHRKELGRSIYVEHWRWRHLRPRSGPDAESSSHCCVSSITRSRLADFFLAASSVWASNSNSCATAAIRVAA